MALSALILAALPATPASAATTLTVCAEGAPTCNHKTIQQAVNASVGGGTVIVRPGQYDEVVSVPVQGLTVCSAPSGLACAPDAAATVVSAPPNATEAAALLSISAKNVRVLGLTLDTTNAESIPSVLVGQPGVTLRDNVLVGGVEVTSGLQDTLVDARMNDWQTYAWRSLEAKVSDAGKGNTVLQIPFKLADGRIEPPLPVMVGPASHSATQANCEGWDADGDGFADGFWDGGCVFLTIQAAIDFAHAGNTLVLPASANPIDPTPRFETITIGTNNEGGTLVGGGTIGGAPEPLDGLTICSGLNDGGDVEPPPGQNPGTCAIDEDAALARQGVIIEGGRNQNLGGAPSGDTVVSVVANNVTLRNLTIQWSGSPDTDFMPASDVTGVAVSGDDATLDANILRLQGGGCTAEDLTAGGCYAPAATTGIRATGVPAGMTVTGNIIRADMPNPNDGSIGGKDGIWGETPGALVEANVFTGWAAHGAQPFGSGAEILSNTFFLNSEGLGICTDSPTDDPIVADGNTFVANFEAVNYPNCSGVTNTLLSNNTMGLTNPTAVRVYPTAGAGTVPAECNDWGVYRSELIVERIVDDRSAGAPDVDFSPWTAPTPADPPLACLLGPFAEYTTDLHADGDTSADDPPPATPDTTRYQSVAFEDLSIGRDGRPIVSWQWNFGLMEGGETILASDGATDGSTSYTFMTTGLKTVTLTVTDADGLTSVASLLINVTDCSTAGPLNTILVPEIPAEFCTIQDAIDAAGPGDHVLLAPGETYFESDITVDVADLTICQGNVAMDGCSAVPATVALNGNDVNGPGSPFFLVEASGVTIDRILFRSNNAPAGDIVDETPGAPDLTVSNSSFNTTASAIVLNNAPTGVTIGSNQFTGGASSNLVVLAGAAGPSTIDLNTLTGCARCVQVSGGSPAVTDNVVTTSTGMTPTHGILLDLTSGAVVSGNDVTGNLAPGGGGAHGIDVEGSTGPTVADNTVNGSAVSIRIASSTDSLLEGNTTTSPRTSTTGGPTYAAALNGGSGNVSRENTFDGAADGLRISGSLGSRSEGDTFTDVQRGVHLLAPAPTGTVIRDGKLGGATNGVVFDSSLSGFIVDARLNDWGVYQHQLLPARVNDNGTNNKALQLPFLLADGTAEPPLPSSAPATHSGTPAVCNAHDSDGNSVPDAEFVSGVCRFLTVQAAIDFAHAGGKVTVPMSQAANPTPWFETLKVATNNEGGSLTGLTVCATATAGLCDSTPAAQARTIIDATAVNTTGVDIEAASVTFQGFTVRRTAPPVPGNVRGIDISTATAPTIKGNAVKMEGGGCNSGGLAGGSCTSGPQSIGIFAGAASSGAQIIGNTVTAAPASSDQSFGGTNGIQATLTGASVISGNTISGWGANGASISGSGAGVLDNTFQGNGDGIAVCASNARVNNNEFLGHASAVVACTGGTGLVMRDNNMDMGNSFAIRFPAGVSSMTIDARLNYWGVSESRLLPLRVLDQQGALSGNKVLQTPFRPNPVP